MACSPQEKMPSTGPLQNNDSIKGAIVWLPETSLDPFSVQIVSVALKDPANASKYATKLQLVWRSQEQPKSWIDYTEGPQGQLVNDKIVFAPGRFRSWLYRGTVRQLGIKIESGNNVDLSEINGTAGTELIPTLATQPASTLKEQWIANVTGGSKFSVSCDASTVDGAKGICLVGLKPGAALSDTVTGGLPLP